MTYYCNDCKQVFDADDARRIDASFRAGDWIKEEYECVCPHCGSDDYSEAVECLMCGEYLSIEDAYDGYCAECINKAATFENLIACDESDNNKGKIEISDTLLAACQDLKIDIEAVLKAAIKESVSKEKLNAFCQGFAKDTDTEYFMNWYKKNMG